MGTLLRIRQERVSRHWTQNQVAARLGLTRVFIHEIETGKAKPSYEVLCKLKNLFNLTHRELFAEATEEAQENNI